MFGIIIYTHIATATSKYPGVITHILARETTPVATIYKVWEHNNG